MARSGQAALETAVRVPRPDLILLDVMMPGLDGYETCRRPKADELTHGIPVIFLAVHDEVEKVVEGFRAGGVDYVGNSPAKPWRPWRRTIFPGTSAS